MSVMIDENEKRAGLRLAKQVCERMGGISVEKLIDLVVDVMMEVGEISDPREKIFAKLEMLNSIGLVSDEAMAEEREKYEARKYWLNQGIA